MFRLVALSLFLHTARACVPVRPGEDLPCPSLAQVQATAASNYLTTGLKASTENKAKVYKCTAPEKLLAVEGGVVTELPDGAKISCQPNSAIFTTDDGKEIGNKKFTCGEKLVPCPTVPEHTTGGLTDAETEAIPAPTMSNGDTIWQCKAPKDHLFLVPKGMPTATMDLGTAATIKCKKQSGKIFLVEGGETEIDPAGMDTYTCGQFSCQLCDQTKLVEPTVAECTMQKDFLCKSKPTVTITANCPMLSCPAGESLYLMDTATTGAPVSDAQVKCDATTKMWLFDGINPIAATAPGFVCALTCDEQCKTPVSMAYAGFDALANDITMSQTAAQPICTYSCGPSYSLTLAGQTYSNIVCDMKTKAVTLDVLGGTAVSDTNKFSCLACNCDTTTDMELTDGSIDLCPMGQLCTNPTAIQNAAGMLKLSPTIKCASTDWITADKTMAGVTCMFSPGKGAYPLPTIPPGTMACPPITPLGGCPGNTCEFAELIYVQKGDGYYITCKKGSLVTDQPGTALTSTCSSGMWNELITMATCDMDDTQVDNCKTTLMAPVAAAISHSCEFGVCYLSCTDPTKQFEYTLASGVEHNKLMKCYLDEVYPVNLELTDPALVKCV
ncbi:hypothetical protein PRIPAC_77694 [Pristionchus pacificus]|uniref:Uncharacterized protein n=1 Tax=Pristionchus pacificus TaxID=54126 RepID=A0A2A6CKY1_PRIPA|nr:hypothetical protein PRIPAC_77694 [Pristionchus pacificus]|eukprot:PDM78766.1 hypothetical protein PRIPAC_31345 [Pristionchus pacificus]